jgi:hypothetical protein
MLSDHNIRRIRRGFLSVFVSLLHGYRQFIRVPSSSTNTTPIHVDSISRSSLLSSPSLLLNGSNSSTSALSSSPAPRRVPVVASPPQLILSPTGGLPASATSTPVVTVSVPHSSPRLSSSPIPTSLSPMPPLALQSGSHSGITSPTSSFSGGLLLPVPTIATSPIPPSPSLTPTPVPHNSISTNSSSSSGSNGKISQSISDEMDEIEASMNLFDGDSFMNCVDDEYKLFMKPFLETQMFKMFIQERVSMEKPDWFELSLTRKTQQRANQTKLHGARHIDGILYKMGRQFPTWHMRHFELRKNNNILRYFLPDPKLDELDRKYTELRALCKGLSNESPLTAQLKVVAAERERLRLDKERGTITLVQGLTEVIIPDTPRRYMTPFVFEILVMKDPRDTKNNPLGERGIDRRLLCCAPTSESRLSWIQVIRARTAKPSIIRSFSGFYQPPESKLQQRLRLARQQQYEAQARMLRTRTHDQKDNNPLRTSTTSSASGDTLLDAVAAISSSASSSSTSSVMTLTPPNTATASTRRPSFSRPSSTKATSPSMALTTIAPVMKLDEDKCLFICKLPCFVSWHHFRD